MKKLIPFMLLLMFPALLLDAVNGWMIRETSFQISLSQVYRIAILGIMLLFIAKFNGKKTLIVLLSIGVLLLGMSYHSQYYEKLSWLVLDLHFNLRMILHFIYFVFFLVLIDEIKRQAGKSEYFIHWVHKLFIFSFVVIAINILLGAVGIGYSTVTKFAVGDSAGYGGLGFFKAGNDVSSTYLVITGFIFYLIWSKNHKFGYYILFGLFALLLAFLLQTKAIIMGTVILFIGVPLVLSMSLQLNWKVNKRLLWLLVLGGSVTVMGISWLVSSDTGIIKRFLYFYDKSGLIFALLTGRSYFFDVAIEVFLTKYNGFDILFGHGWSYYLQEMSNIYGKDKLVEIDYVDIFMINGVSGLMLELSFWFTYLSIAFKGARNSPLCRLVLLVDVLMLGLAATAGHVFYSTVNCMFIGLLNALPVLENKMKQRGRRVTISTQCK